MTREDQIKRGLIEHPVPDDVQAEQRSWDVVGAAFEEGERSRTRSRGSRSTMIVTALAASAAILGLTLTPAGAKVSEWVRSAVGGSTTATRERPALTHVPSGGRLLVSTGTGQWVVAEDGSRRFLGDFGSAAWSPGGLFIAVADGDALAVVSPDGDQEWSVSAPGEVADPIWAPGCCRVAYRSGGAVWVVDGSGNFNHRLAPGAAAVAPTWRPARYDLESQASRNVLAYVDIEDRLRAVDVDSGKRLADLQLAARPIAIHWLSRERVLIASPDQVQIADTESGTAETAYTPAPSAGAIVGVDGYPGGSKAAVLVTTKADGQDEARSRLVLIDTQGDRRPRTAFSGLGHFDGPLLSPNGTRAQLGWRDAGQWLFVPTDRTADVIAVDNIPRQFDSGGSESDPLPRIESWCCR